MEKRKAYYVSRKNVLTWLSVLFILCSAVVRLVLLCEKGTASGSAMAFQILLPSIAEVIFVLIVIFNGKERIYRTAIPVAVIAFSVMHAAATYGLWHKLLVWLACIVFAVYYYEAISGRMRGANRLVLFLLSLFMLFLRAVPENYMALQYRTMEQWIGDLPTMSSLVGILLLVLALRLYQDGKYHPTWGDRPDGRRVRTLDPLSYMTAYIMVNRNGASNSFRESLDITDTDRYIRRRRREGMTQLTITQIYLAAYCRVVARYPALNRFVNGQQVYTRDGDIVFSMVIKREMSTTGEETSIKLHLTPYDTLDTVSEKLASAIKQAKNETSNDFDKTAGALKAIPGLFLKFTVWLLKTMDYFGLLPKFLLEVSPFHGSVFFTSMASLGIPAIYHHLYDFGNLPVFCCLGGKYRKPVLMDDGSLVERTFMDLNVVCDERICDGFYYAAAMKYFKRLMLHPDLLEKAPEVVNPDQE
ncbi:MAG: hypothetical protein IJP11_07235 [Oscillospiraceae bacterium]|nr:hypothetical protein [Oscillospiraceae bacterium]